MIKSENDATTTRLDDCQVQELWQNQDECRQTKSGNLLSLNDDCLLKILQYLSVQETFSLIGAFDSRFDDIAYKRIAKLKYLKFSLRDPPTFTPYQLKIIGRHLTHLNISIGYSLDTDCCSTHYLAPLCHFGAIQNLTLNYFHFNEGYQKPILNVAPNIQFLDLSFCDLTDDLLQPILENWEQLQTLVLLANYDLRGQSLHSIRSRHLDSVTIELNDPESHEVRSFIRDNANIYVKVYEKFRRRHWRYYQGNVNLFHEF